MGATSWEPVCIAVIGINRPPGMIERCSFVVSLIDGATAAIGALGSGVGLVEGEMSMLAQPVSQNRQVRLISEIIFIKTGSSTDEVLQKHSPRLGLMHQTLGRP